MSKYPRDIPVTVTLPSPMLPAWRLAFWNRHTCFTKQIYRDGKKLLLIHWQPLYISCHWNSIFILADINKYSYFEYKLIYKECEAAGFGLMLFNDRRL